MMNMRAHRIPVVTRKSSAAEGGLSLLRLQLEFELQLQLWREGQVLRRAAFLDFG